MHTGHCVQNNSISHVTMVWHYFKIMVFYACIQDIVFKMILFHV